MRVGGGRLRSRNDFSKYNMVRRGECSVTVITLGLPVSATLNPIDI